MNAKDADACAIKLKAHFPKIADEVVRYWSEKFEGFDLQLATQAIDDLAETREEFSTPALFMLLRVKRASVIDSGAESRADDKRRKKEIEKIDRRIDGMSHETVAALAREAIEDLNSFSRSRLENSNPRTSAWIKALIVARTDASKPKGGSV